MYIDIEGPDGELVNSSFDELARRIGHLVVTNSLLLAENRALLARIEALSTSGQNSGSDAEGSGGRTSTRSSRKASG